MLNGECALFIRRAERAQYVIEISEDKRMMTDHHQESRFFKHAVSPMYFGSVIWKNVLSPEGIWEKWMDMNGVSLFRDKLRLQNRSLFIFDSILGSPRFQFC